MVLTLGLCSDYGRYIPGQPESALPVATVDNFQNVGNTTIGPSYWQLCHHFSNTTTFVVQLPMATTNISETIAWATSAVNTIGWDQIEALEPGNEADLYGIDNLKPPKYQGFLTNETYASLFVNYSTAITAALDVPPRQARRMYQALDTSSKFGVVDSYNFDVETIFSAGVDSALNVKSVGISWFFSSSIPKPGGV